MATIPSFKGNTEVDITKVHIGVQRIVPYGLELEVKEDSYLWDFIINNSSFQAILDGALVRRPKETYPESKGYYEKEMQRLDKLEQNIKGCKPKITIKIELEKYE